MIHEVCILIYTASYRYNAQVAKYKNFVIETISCELTTLPSNYVAITNLCINVWF